MAGAPSEERAVNFPLIKFIVPFKGNRKGAFVRYSAVAGPKRKVSVLEPSPLMLIGLPLPPRRGRPHTGGMASRAPTSKPVLRIFRSEVDQEWFAVTQRPSSLPAALAPWFPADEQEMPVLAHSLERDRVQKIVDADGFYLFRSRGPTSDGPAN